ncbi:hypothetical protein [Desulfofundulus salinus]|uniref:Uncharacterized protein n=1 Tax=Desulfofundulus salinus TaxID=2419843 RepID=A0A494WVT6_9FIRM|nr:hypothetical protein [Desulfofundulus salinum]RKO67151.1 hypothetical protein D7024_09440 [Desulfofundulus salinum]
MTTEEFLTWLDNLQEEMESGLLEAGYSYRDIEDAKTAILALTSEEEKEARQSLLSRFKKEKLALLFYMVGRMDGMIDGFKQGYNEALYRQGNKRGEIYKHEVTQ